MRVTDDDYKNIIDFCHEPRMTTSVMKLLGEGSNFTINVLTRMKEYGILEVENIPYKGQTRNLYKATPNAYKLLKKRIESRLNQEKLRASKNKASAKERARNKKGTKEKHKKIMSMMTKEWQRPDYFAQAFDTTASAMGKTLDAMSQIYPIEKSTITVGKYSKVVYRKKKKELGLRKVTFGSKAMQEKLLELDELYREDKKAIRSRVYIASTSNMI